MSNNIDANFQPVAAKLDGIDARLTQAIAKAKSRNAVTLIVSLVLLILMGIYLGYAYRQFSTVDPAFAASYGQASLMAYLPDAEKQLRQQLHDKEDDILGNAEKSFRAMPEQLATNVKANVIATVDQRMPEMEERMVSVLKDALSKAPPAAANVTPEQHFHDMLGRLADTADKQIDAAYATYSSTSDDLLRYLDKLAENKNLDERQQLQRETIQSFLVLVKQRDAAGATTMAGQAN